MDDQLGPLGDMHPLDDKIAYALFECVGSLKKQKKGITYENMFTLLMDLKIYVGFEISRSELEAFVAGYKATAKEKEDTNQ